MARFTLPRDLYHGKGALEALKTFEGKRAIICVGGGSMKKFGFLDRAVGYLKEAGMDYADVVKTTCFLANISDFAAFNAIYAEYFKGEVPARSCFAVKDLPMGGLVEIECIAVK